MRASKLKTFPFIQAFIKKAPEPRFFGPDRGYLRLNHNEMSGLLPKSFVEKISKEKDIFSTYPSYEKLHLAIAQYTKTPPSHIQTVNGSDDGIPKLVRVLFNSGRSIILPVPVFPTYERALKIEGVPINEIPYIGEKNKFVFPLKSVIAAIQSKKNQGLIICNPSNPLGSGISKKDLKILIKETEKVNIPLIIDEAYFEFYGVTGIPFIEQYPHVIVLRTFSKTFGLAGLRIGYVVAAPSIIRALQKLILPWEVNHVAVSSALLALSLKKHFLKQLEKTKLRAVRLQTLLQKYDLVVFQTSVNFVVCKAKNAHALAEILQQEGVIVRPLLYAAHQLPLLKDCIRISVPGPDIEKEAFRRIRRALMKYVTL